jgi:5-methylcytosine-specific restriction endonuclease McrA
MKICTKCGLPKPKFHKDRTRADGLFPWCSDCVSADNKKQYKANSVNVRAAVAARKKANPEAVRRRNRSYYRRNKARHAAHGRRWVLANRERRREVVRQWEQSHKVYGRLKAALRRARIRGLQVSVVSEAAVAARVAVYGGRCAYCGGPYEHIDHVKPIKLGGPHILANLRPACEQCNLRKGAMPPMVWLRSLACSTKSKTTAESVSTV